MEIKQTPCSENRRTRKKISEKSKNLLKSPGKQISIGYKSEKLKLEKSILPIRVTTLMPASNLLSCFNKLMCPYRHLLTLNVLIFLIFMSLINFANCVYINTGGNSQNQEEASLRFKRSYFEINNKVGSRQMSSRDTRSVGSISGESTSFEITGIRVEDSGHNVQFEDGIPSVLGDTEFIVRVFGKGLTKDTVIAFSTQARESGAHCQFPSTLLHKPLDNSVTDTTALYEIKLPSSKEEFFICAKKDPDSFKENQADPLPLIHKCKESWCALRSHESFLPLWVSILVITICLCFSALFSGLNLGLMSLDRTELKILRNTGSNKEREYAKKIQPVRDQGNYLLCSILLGNVLVNSTFTILLDGLTSGLIAVVCSTIAIVIFGEITPQAICSRHGLAVGAKTIYVTKMVMIVTFPLAYPTSKILDYLLGEEIGNVYNRERLKELVKVTTGINDLDKNEVNIISGALELRKKTVTDVMTHIDDAFMIPLDATLDFETVSEIMKTGYSRIPVYDGDRKNIVTLLYIKDLAFVDPDDNTPLRTLCEFYQNPVHFVFEDVTLDVMFNQFKDGTFGHLAFVHRVNDEGDGDPFYETIGLVTLEDVIEELIQAEIVDETDVFVDNRTKVRRNRYKKQDFTVFAERREHQTIHISPQLALATFQYLSTSVDAFRNDIISEAILRRLLNQNIIFNIKCKGKEKDDPSLFLYQQSKPADYFVLILEGRVEVKAGKENLLFEGGPFTYFGTQAFAPVAFADTSSQQGSLQSLNLENSKVRQTFIPDYSVRALADVTYIAIKRNLYLTAKKATLLEKTRKSGTSFAVDFDAEVEKLLHSLHEDDRQQFFRGSQNLRKGSMALTVSNTASPSLNDFSQQSRSIAATVTQQNSHGSNSGEINEVISMSSLLTSETAANNNDLNTHEYVCNDDGGGGGGGGGDKAIVTTPLLPKSDLKHNNINAK